MLDVYKRLFRVLDRSERLTVFGLLLLILLTSVVEAGGVASVMPFISVLSDPSVIERSEFLSTLYAISGLTSVDKFLGFLGLSFLFLLLGSIAMRAFTFWSQLRFSQTRNHFWSVRLISRYLDYDYEWFLRKHSGDLGSSILTEVNKIVNDSLFQSIQFVANVCVALVLIALMLLVDARLALSVAFGLGAAYGIIYFSARGVLAELGQQTQALNRKRYKHVSELFSGIKEVKIYGLESDFIRRYSVPSERFALKQVSARSISALPAFLLQALVFGGVVAIVLYFFSVNGGVADALPYISLFALAGYRLMPALQASYNSLAAMRVSHAVLRSLSHELVPLKNKRTPDRIESPRNSYVDTSSGCADIVLDHVSYSYPHSNRWALNDVSLRIPARTSVAFVGPSGSGKTTLADLLLGLLRSEHGNILIGGFSLNDPVSRPVWTGRVGYVPQSIFLSDDTVAANIAFGQDRREWCWASIEAAAQAASLHEFIQSELSLGYDTFVGERGVRLSGGQRQRLGIARALYRDPEVLILDEATSALDNITESEVLNAINSLSATRTVIIIAHRLGTIRGCDRIFFLSDGRIQSEGSFEELLTKSESFKKMVQAEMSSVSSVSHGS